MIMADSGTALSEALGRPRVKGGMAGVLHSHIGGAQGSAPRFRQQGFARQSQ